eukprot:scaffold153_cov314-Prasinococcus_capsulatus_cf.AAC.9
MKGRESSPERGGKARAFGERALVVGARAHGGPMRRAPRTANLSEDTSGLRDHPFSGASPSS